MVRLLWALSTALQSSVTLLLPAAVIGRVAPRTVPAAVSAYGDVAALQKARGRVELTMRALTTIRLPTFVNQSKTVVRLQSKRLKLTIARSSVFGSQ